MENARVNITWNGRNGDLPDPVRESATDVEILAWVTEAIRDGGVPGLPADRHVDLRDFVVDRFDATPQIPFPRIFVRPKTPFGER
jgi:hypothetical protein